MAVVGSASVASPGEGAVFMLLFGLGTWPMMFGLGALGYGVKGWVIQRFRRWVPIFIIVLGILFILRGSNLGIPYVSPQISPDKVVVDCD
jgi:sulfite exporter TauE/SafE